ncbi:Transcription factor-like protein DPB [Quillaja saponaria]|uniref:Transcription factor-like protein DPB n=1 Tax=Quillaja saponaria TaxID=32244 RepID=A0AAD7PSR6_QUISA|nr:Transcription factor-like protein DPB [Quillaja saponaria]
MAMDIISKDKKEIQWKGLPRTSQNDIEELKTERVGLRNRLEKKAAYLQELEDQYVGLQNLTQRNEQLYSSGNAPSGGVALPFILVQVHVIIVFHLCRLRTGSLKQKTSPVFWLKNKTQFQCTPFELHDGNYILRAMKFYERPQGDNLAQNFTADGGEDSSMSGMYQPQVPLPSVSNPPGRPPPSPPLPGILKARVKHEH